MNEEIQNTAIAEFEKQKVERDAFEARVAEARKAGCLTRELANMSDGGRMALGEKAWKEIQDFWAGKGKK